MHLPQLNMLVSMKGSLKYMALTAEFGSKYILDTLPLLSEWGGRGTFKFQFKLIHNAIFMHKTNHSYIILNRIYSLHMYSI